MTKRQKKTAEESGEQKEHKKNWREEYATVEEIKDFLRAHVFLRYNMVKHQVEVRLPTQDTFCCNEELEQFATDDWQLMDNRLYKTLLSALQTVKPARERDFELVMGSGFVPSYHPFQYYLNRLPPWDGQNHILLLAASVTVKGGGREAAVLLQVPQEMARGDGGQLARRRGGKPDHTRVHRRAGPL